MNLRANAWIAAVPFIMARQLWDYTTLPVGLVDAGDPRMAAWLARHIQAFVLDFLPLPPGR